MGQLALDVDATDVAHRVVHVHETITHPELENGVLTLAYPKWLPGNHSPTGPIERLAGIRFRSNGRLLNWTRNPVDINVFHVTVGTATAVDVDFDYLSPTSTKIGKVEISDDITTLKWQECVLYPLQVTTRDIPVSVQVTLPGDYAFATALEAAEPPKGGVVRFKTTDLETLIDSPLYSGRYSKSFDLSENTNASSPPVTLHVFADKPAGLNLTDAQLKAHRQLVSQASKLFGAHHYKHYDFLLTLSDEVQHIGLEHHQSSEDGTSFDTFTNWDKSITERDLLGHEYTHSWNGKFRRPADLWTPNYQQPMQDSLLWVYEGQTQYWGHVLTARSGLSTQSQAIEALALTAAYYDQQQGRQWRPLEDTTNDPVIGYRKPRSWSDWQRAEDYYSEGQLIWLEVDTIIRSESHQRASLDDFARKFFGIEDGKITATTYYLQDVVRTLNEVVPFTWDQFFQDRVYTANAPAPLRGIEQAGYRLVYNNEPNAMIRSEDRDSAHISFRYSLGVNIDKHGKIKDVAWNGLAYKLGFIEGMDIVAVNGETYSTEKLETVIKASLHEPKSVELIVKNNDHYRVVRFDYEGGLKIPHLERIKDRPDVLADIFKAK